MVASPRLGATLNADRALTCIIATMRLTSGWIPIAAVGPKFRPPRSAEKGAAGYPGPMVHGQLRASLAGLVAIDLAVPELGLFVSWRASFNGDRQCFAASDQHDEVIATPVEQTPQQPR
jgi:hypothetical protein